MADTPRVLLSCFGMHMGGGLVLLRALLGALGSHLKHAALDARVPDELLSQFPSSRISPVRRSFVARVVGLFALCVKAGPADVLLCLNSLPPLWRPRCKVVVYVHALYLVNMHRDSQYTLLTTLRIWIERTWFKLGIRNADECWVQTAGMAAALQQAHPSTVVRILPFVDDHLTQKLAHHSVAIASASFDASQHIFYYPAEAVGHKNHATLVRAWALLDAQGLHPQLLLTLAPNEVARVAADAGLDLGRLGNVRNLGRITRPEALQHMANASALIFPSLAETLGLPLLEARAIGKPILASERNFVRDVCLPDQTFDPHSAASIAHAVRRFMGIPLPPPTFLNATQFVDALLALKAR